MISERADVHMRAACAAALVRGDVDDVIARRASAGSLSASSPQHQKALHTPSSMVPHGARGAKKQDT